MAKSLKQKLYDDLNALVEKYPNMRAGVFMDTLDQFGRAMFRCLPASQEGKPSVTLKHRTKTYRLG